MRQTWSEAYYSFMAGRSDFFSAATILYPERLRKFVSRKATFCNGSIKQELQMTYGVSGVDWRFDKHPLPKNVYDVYMRYWEEVALTPTGIDR
jgi:hypothetical protein